MKTEIIETLGSEIRIANVTANELTNQEVVDAICLEMYEAQQDEKEAKSVYTSAKNNARRLFDERFGKDSEGTFYSPKNNKKIHKTIRNSGVKIDQDKMLKSLYDYYGEDYSNRQGKAWKAFCKVSQPVDCPRVIDPNLFEAEFLKSQKEAAGIGNDCVNLPLSAFYDAQVEGKQSVAISVRNMTKAEKTAAEEDLNGFETIVGE